MCKINLDIPDDLHRLTVLRGVNRAWYSSYTLHVRGRTCYNLELASTKTCGFLIGLRRLRIFLESYAGSSSLDNGLFLGRVARIDISIVFKTNDTSDLQDVQFDAIKLWMNGLGEITLVKDSETAGELTPEELPSQRLLDLNLGITGSRHIEQVRAVPRYLRCPLEDTSYEMYGWLRDVCWEKQKQKKGKRAKNREQHVCH